MIVVIDASVAIKWYLEENHTSDALCLLNKNIELHAPELFLPEFGNILWKKYRGKDIPEIGHVTVLNLLTKQAITLHSHKELLNAAVFGAIKTGQTVYDWTYLSLAVALDCPFVTADRRFYDALKTTTLKKHLEWIEDVPRLLT